MEQKKILIVEDEKDCLLTIAMELRLSERAFTSPSQF